MLSHLSLLLTQVHIQNGPTLAEDVKIVKSPYIDRHSAFNPTNARANAETELLALHSPKETHNTVAILNLCGLYGGSRSIRRYVGRIAGTKEQLRAKGAIHMVHGIDVARAILGAAKGPSHMVGERWLLTGEFCTHCRSRQDRIDITPCHLGRSTRLRLVGSS